MTVWLHCPLTSPAIHPAWRLSRRFCRPVRGAARSGAALTRDPETKEALGSRAQFAAAFLTKA
jgi:hypothetical protein